MNRKNKKRAFITSIIMLLISAIVLTSSTFAWFIMGDKVEIQEMDIKLYSSEGIQISANATEPSWRNYLTLNNIFDTEGTDTVPEEHNDLIDNALHAYDGNRNMLPEYLIPASSNFNKFNNGDEGKSSDGYPTFYRARVQADGSTTVDYVLEGSVKEAQSKYPDAYANLPEGKTADKYNAIAEKAGIIAFDIFIKSPAAQTIDFSATEIKEIQGKDEAGNKLPATNNIAAIRYAFVPMGTADIGTDKTAAASIQQLKDAKADKVTIAEAESYLRSDDAKDKLKGGNEEGHITTVPLGGTSATSADMKDVIVGTDAAAPQGKVYWSDEKLPNGDPAPKTFDLEAGITKMRVYVWAEGNDVDCRDSIASSELSVAFKFGIAEE